MGKWIGVAVAILVLLFVGYIAAAAYFPDFRVISRDIAIFLLALTGLFAMIIMVAILAAILYAVTALRKTMQQQVIPQIAALNVKLDRVVDDAMVVSNNAKDTVASVSTSTIYVAEQVVTPVIRARSLFAGIRAAVMYVARRQAPE